MSSDWERYNDAFVLCIFCPWWKRVQYFNIFVKRFNEVIHYFTIIKMFQIWTGSLRRQIVIKIVLISEKLNCSCSMWSYTNLLITTGAITAAIFELFLGKLDIWIICRCIAMTRFKSNSNELRTGVANL